MEKQAEGEKRRFRTKMGAKRTQLKYNFKVLSIGSQHWKQMSCKEAPIAELNVESTSFEVVTAQEALQILETTYGIIKWLLS